MDAEKVLETRSIGRWFDAVGSFLVGNKSPASSFFHVRLWLVRCLGLIHVVAFSIIFFQGVALWGKNGLLPIDTYVDAAEQHFGGTSSAFWNLPSLFYFASSDRVIVISGLLGMVLGGLMVLGYANFFILLPLWLMQLSYENSGQLFYGYGWEAQLSELTFLSFFLVPFFDPRLKKASSPPPRVTVWAMRWMLFRLMLGAGLIKLRGDRCWWDLTCLIYHYETQPIPNPLSYFYHQMPPAFHYGGALFNHFCELVVPLGYFSHRPRIRRLAGLITIVFQSILISSGNLAWLNWLTLVMCIPCFDDECFAWLDKRLHYPKPAWRKSRVQYVVLGCFAMAIVWLSIDPALNLVNNRQAMNTSYEPWHLVNSYGAFGTIGRERDEIIIEATDELEVTEHTMWKPYEFKCAPGDLTRRPPWVILYHHHLDWQIWFSGMRPRLQEEWLFRLVVRLLENDPEIKALFASTPFGEKPPTYIKMDLYRYQFADWKDWPKFWWKRTWIREYMPPVSLDQRLAQAYRKPAK